MRARPIAATFSNDDAEVARILDRVTLETSLAAALSAESRLRAPTSAATCQSLSMVVGLFLSRCRSLSLSLSLFSESAGGRSLSLSLRWLRPGSANVPVEGNGMLEGILKQSILVPSGRLFVCFDSG